MVKVRGSLQALGWRAIVPALFSLGRLFPLEVCDAGLHSVVQRFFTLNPLKTNALSAWPRMGRSAAAKSICLEKATLTTASLDRMIRARVRVRCLWRPTRCGDGQFRNAAGLYQPLS